MILTITLNPCVDRTLFVSHLVPGDANRVLRTETDAGGKGINLSRVAAELGAQSMALGFLGGGPGGFVKAVLDREAVKHDFVEIAGETRVNVNIEAVEGNTQPTTFNDRGPEIDEHAWNKLLSKFQSYASYAKWACIGGSIPPGLPQDAFRTLGKAIKGAGCKLVLDADGEPLKLGLEAQPDFVKPNAHEAERLFQEPVRTKRESLWAARQLHGKGAQIAVISRGAAGASMACDEGSFDGISPQVEAKSTIGSGDSMIGAMLWALEDGRSMVEAFAYGLAAGAATATTSGAEIARRSVISDLLPMVKIEKHRE